jgi:hypothetical protein
MSELEMAMQKRLPVSYGYFCGEPEFKDSKE